MNNDPDTRETEYFCPACQRPHRSIEDKSIYEAHKGWNTRLCVRTVPARYYTDSHYIER